MKPITTIISSIFFSLILIPEVSLAQGLVSCNENCTVCDLIKTGDNVLRFLMEISFILVVAFIAYGAILIMTSGGNKGQFEKGKKAIWTSLTGLVIILVAWVFVHSLLSVLAGRNLYQGNFRDWVWNEIPCEIEK